MEETWREGRRSRGRWRKWCRKSGEIRRPVSNLYNVIKQARETHVITNQQSCHILIEALKSCIPPYDSLPALFTNQDSACFSSSLSSLTSAVMGYWHKVPEIWYMVYFALDPLLTDLDIYMNAVFRSVSAAGITVN